MKKTFRSVVRVALALLVISHQSLFAEAGHDLPWMGQVSYVGDGDSIYVRPLNGGKPVSIRLHGIEAPEICQQGGTASRAALQRRSAGRQVRVAGKTRDSYGRLVAQVFLDGDDLGGWMVTQGQAWSYRYRGQNGPYGVQQRHAQQAGRGLFANSSVKPLYPGEFRRHHGACRR